MSDPTSPPEPDAPKPNHTDHPLVTIDQEGNTRGASDQPQSAANPGAPPEPPPPPSTPPPRRSAAGPVLGVLGFLVLAGGIGYVWYQQQQFQQHQPDTAAQLHALEQKVQSLSQQLSRMQAQPASRVPAELKTLSAKVEALQQQKAPDLSSIESRLTALEQRKQTDLTPLENQVKALQEQIATIQQQSQQINGLSQQVKTLAQQVQDGATRSQQATSALTQRLDTDESRLVTLEHNSSKISQLSERATRLARLQAAQMALAQGHALGDIPGAPAALARYASDPPPTEASLRLAFPAAEKAAFSAVSPDTADKPFLSRVLANAEGLVTVRQGDHVLVGNPTAGVLARAHAALEAGDLAGAVADVSSLSGPPAQAMQPWLSQAKALLAARSALADMVAKA